MVLPRQTWLGAILRVPVLILVAVNPFAKREEHDKRAIFGYKLFTIITWILAVVVSFYYTFNAPHDGAGERHTIWGQNSRHETAFKMNPIIASIYW